MKSKSIYKIPDGKLVKISLDYDKEKKIIKKIKIMGDFFAYPNEAIEFLEKHLINTKIEEKILIKKINQDIINNNFKFIGINAEGLTQGILLCLK